jgi:hypothetical protein
VRIPAENSLQAVFLSQWVWAVFKEAIRKELFALPKHTANPSSEVLLRKPTEIWLARRFTKNSQFV